MPIDVNFSALLTKDWKDRREELRLELSKVNWPVEEHGKIEVGERPGDPNVYVTISCRPTGYRPWPSGWRRRRSTEPAYKYKFEKIFGGPIEPSDIAGSVRKLLQVWFPGSAL